MFNTLQDGYKFSLHIFKPHFTMEVKPHFSRIVLLEKCMQTNARSDLTIIYRWLGTASCCAWRFYWYYRMLPFVLTTRSFCERKLSTCRGNYSRFPNRITISKAKPIFLELILFKLLLASSCKDVKTIIFGAIKHHCQKIKEKRAH